MQRKALQSSYGNKALFLDRDGVINKDKHFLYKHEDVEFIDGIFDLCRSARAEGYKIIIITNQSGIARGYFTETEFRALMHWIERQFVKKSADIDATIFCPHHPEHGFDQYKINCHCRKPKPGMLTDASERYAIDLSASLFIGDRVSDMEAAAKAGVGKKVLFSPSNTKIHRSNLHDQTVNHLLEVLAFL